MNGHMNPQSSDPSDREVELALAAATLEAHVEVATGSGSVCAICQPVTEFPCVYVVQARRTLEEHEGSEEP